MSAFIGPLVVLFVVVIAFIAGALSTFGRRQIFQPIPQKLGLRELEELNKRIVLDSAAAQNIMTTAEYLGHPLSVREDIKKEKEYNDHSVLGAARAIERAKRTIEAHQSFIDEIVERNAALDCYAALLPSAPDPDPAQ